MNDMLAVLKEKAAPGAVVTRVETPRIGPKDLLLKVRATSICGTDLHIYDWDEWARTTIRPPLVFGHEFCAEVVEKGREAGDFKVGDLVAVESHIPCDDCVQCRTGMRHICDNLQIVGIHRPGSYAEYVSMPAVCAWKIPPGTPPEIGSIMEPMGNAVHAVSAAGVRGKKIAVFGCGPTGLFAVAVAAASDAEKIVAVDIDPGRLELARAVGAGDTLDGSAEDIADQVGRACGAGGAEVVFEMSGSSTGLIEGLKAVRKGGTFVAFGIAPRPIELDISNEVIMKGRRILGVVGRLMFRTWEEMQRLLDGGRLDPTPVITHRFPLAEFDKAIGTLKDRTGKCAKVVLFP